MFRRTLKLMDQRQLKIIQDLYVPNDKDLDFRIPYELRGQNLARRKLNPYKKTPLRVTYDPNDFSRYVLPSQRELTFHSNIIY